MNQAILFPDMQSWSEETQQIVFPVQVNGLLVDCVVMLPTLERISGQSIRNADEALQIFGQFRFDLEELAENAIDSELYNSQGQVNVTA